MTLKNVTETKAELSALLVLVENGEEVVIARGGKPIARITKFEAPSTPRTLGAYRGKFWIADDFDAPDPKIEKLFYEGAIEPSA